MSTTGKTRLAAAPEESLDPEERMSRDELESIQLRRLQHTVRTAYEKVPTYRTKSMRSACTPTTSRL